MRILLPTMHVRRSPQSVPLAAGCLKAALPEHFHHETKLLNLFPEQTNAEICSDLLEYRPELIAFPLYLWNRKRILKICRELRQQHPSVQLFVGGPEASADHQAVIAEGRLDGVIYGEGEILFTELVQRLENKVPLNGLTGLITETSHNHPQAAACPDLAKLPSPWLLGTIPLNNGDGVLWEIARGCHFNCAFCYDAKGQQGVRSLPFERLTAELDLFVRSGVTQIWILDSTFNAPLERGKQLLQLLIERAPQIHFHLEAKADFLDAETAEMLSHLSCSVQIGLQSVRQEILKPLHRSLQPESMSKMLKLLSDVSVTFGLDLIYGLPGDNHAGFRNSLDFALMQQPNQVDIFPLAVLPGTELFQLQNEFGITAQEKPPYLIETNHSYSTSDLLSSQQLAAACDIFYNRGRAVGFLLQLCETLKLLPSEFLEQFYSWLTARTDLSAQQILAVDQWQPKTILAIQQDFVAATFRNSRKKQLLKLCEDLLNYHYLCAETMLAAICQPATELPPEEDFLDHPWQLNPTVRVQKFHYDLEELEIYGGGTLNSTVKQLHPDGSIGIFLQKDGEILIESIGENFAKLLLGSQGQIQPRQLFSGIDDHEIRELLSFAVTEGLLLPTS